MPLAPKHEAFAQARAKERGWPHRRPVAAPSHAPITP